MNRKNMARKGDNILYNKNSRKCGEDDDREMAKDYDRMGTIPIGIKKRGRPSLK